LSLLFIFKFIVIFFLHFNAEVVLTSVDKIMFTSKDNFLPVIIF